MCFGFVVVCESLSDAQNRRQQNFVGYGLPSFTETLCMIKISAINSVLHSTHLTYFNEHSSSQNELRKKKKTVCGFHLGSVIVDAFSWLNFSTRNRDDVL